MTFWVLKQIKKLLTQLNSTEDPRVLSLGIVFALVLGLPSFHFFYTFLVLLFLILVKANIPLALLFWPLFSFVGALMSPISHYIGLLLLVKFEFLSGLWTFLTNLPLLSYLYFNHTVTLGSYVLIILLSPAIFKAGLIFVNYYRKTLMPKITKSKVMTVLKSSKFVGWIFRFLGE